MELKETVDLMLSANYKERFVAEYWQLKIRYDKLKLFCNKIKAANMAGTEEPRHDCPLNVLQEQANIMYNLLCMLELRAEIEHVNLNRTTVSDIQIKRTEGAAEVTFIGEKENK